MSTALEAFRNAPREEIQLGTARVRYRRFGSGPATVFVHGWPVNGATYRDLIPRVSHRMTCIVPDLPGAGDSPWDPRMQHLFEGGGALVRELVDGLGLDRVALVAHDSGGLIARVAAAQLGRRLTALFLTNTEVPNHHSNLIELYARTAAAPGAPRLFKALLASKRYRHSGLGFGSCFDDRSLIDGDFRTTCIEPMRERMADSLRLLQAIDFDYIERLPEIHGQISAPVACVWGAHDPFFPVDKARAMMHQFRDPRGFTVVDRARLFVHEEAPDTIAEHLLRLLDEATQPDLRPAVAAS